MSIPVIVKAVAMPGTPPDPSVKPLRFSVSEEQAASTTLEKVEKLLVLSWKRPVIFKDIQKPLQEVSLLHLASPPPNRSVNLSAFALPPNEEVVENAKRSFSAPEQPKEVIHEPTGPELWDNARTFVAENFPEIFFTRQHLLYVKVKMKGTEFYALVDTGAQISILSADICERAGMTGEIDTRQKTVLRGVGESHTKGIVWLSWLSLGTGSFPFSFTVVDNQKNFCIIGLDMLRRHRAEIDLERFCMHIGVGDQRTECEFLQEHDLSTLGTNFFGM